MPVRKVPRNYCNVTGLTAIPGQRSVRVESTLERDFVLRTIFHPKFRHIEEQPLVIPVPETAGKYIPDFLVTWEGRRELIEVKPAAKLVSDKARLRPRFAAARAYCRSSGLSFRVATEAHIRGPYLDNARFLMPYRHREVDDDLRNRLLGSLQGGGPCSLEELLQRATGSDRLAALPVLWHLLANFRVRVDLNAPIDMNSIAKPARGKPWAA